MTAQLKQAQISAVQQELDALLQMGVQLAVGPARAGWLWELEHAGAVVDILTGDIFPTQADHRPGWLHVAEVC